MEIDYSPRQSGKTTRMLEWLRADQNRVLLVHNYEYAHELGIENKDVKDRIMSWNDYIPKQKGRNPLEHVAIDNAEFFFRSRINAPIDKISMSTPETI
jgi:thymidine kinase